MNNKSRTVPPRLTSPLLTDDTQKLLADALTQVAELHGVGLATQDDQGRTVAIRINSATRQVECFLGGAWTPLGSRSGTAISPAGTLNTSVAQLAALSVGAAYDQDEITALRSAVVELSRDIQALHTKINEVVTALQAG